jgi:hypothetical protein
MISDEICCPEKSPKQSIRNRKGNDARAAARHIFTLQEDARLL